MILLYTFLIHILLNGLGFVEIQSFETRATGSEVSDRSAKADTNGLQRLHQQAEYFITRNPDSSRTLAKVLLRKAKAINDQPAIAMAFSTLGNLSLNQGRYDSAYYFHNQALLLRRKLRLEDEAAITCSYLADVEKNRGKPERALKLLLSELSGVKEKTNSTAVGHLHNSLGRLYDYMGNKAQALACFTKAQQIFRNLNPDEYASAISNTGSVHLRYGDIKKADSYYHKAQAAYTRTGNKRGLAGIYSNQSNILFAAGNDNGGLNKLQQALRLYNELEDKTGQVSVLNNLAVYYHKKNQPEQALPYYLKSISLARQLHNTQLEHDITGNIFLIYKSLNKPAEALPYLEKYTELHDEIFNSTRSQQIAEIQAKFDTEKRNRQIQSLKSEKENQQTAISRRTWERNAAIGGLLATIVLAFLLVRSFRQQQRSEAELLARNEELNQKQVEELLREQELISVHGRLQGQEAERKRIAQDLHDRLGSLLATLKLYFHMSRTEEQRKITTELLDTACQEVRQIAYDMVSGVLMKFGLVAALQDLAQAINQSGQIRMKVTYEGLDNRLDSPIEIELYRIMQELVSNTLKHAQATEINVLLTRYEQSVNLLVEDNGKGFNPQQTSSRWGMGIQGIKSRVEKMKGTLTIDSGQGIGTTFLISVPTNVSQLALVPTSDNDTRYKPLV